MLSSTLAPRRASFALNERKYCSVTVEVLAQLILCHGRDAFHARTPEAQCGTEAILVGNVSEERRCALRCRTLARAYAVGQVSPVCFHMTTAASQGGRPHESSAILAG